jgi:hypothetical protein
MTLLLTFAYSERAYLRRDGVGASSEISWRGTVERRRSPMSKLVKKKHQPKCAVALPDFEPPDAAGKTLTPRSSQRS